MRRKLGILILVGVTVLAGTKEAVRQFDGLRSSLNDLTRASLWSGLIVYAQPVADGKLPSPQIYYLMPRDTQQPASPAAQPEAVLADNNSNAAKPEAKNNHTQEAAEASTNVLASAVVTAREVEDAAKSELVLLPQHAGAVVAAAPKLEKPRVYEEMARNEVAARRFKQDADAVAKVFVKEFNAAKIKAETERFVAAQEQLETLKLKALSDAERLHGQIENSRIELRALRRAPRPEQVERHNKAVISLTEEHETSLHAISDVACEKMVNTQEGLALDAPAAIEAPAAVPAVPAATATAPVTSVRSVSEPLAEAEVSPVITLMGNNWALDCDTEPEFK